MTSPRCAPTLPAAALRSPTRTGWPTKSRALARAPAGAGATDPRAAARPLARRQRDLRPAVTQIEWQDGRARVVFAAVDFARLVASTRDTAARIRACAIVDATLTARVEPGTVARRARAGALTGRVAARTRCAASILLLAVGLLLLVAGGRRPCAGVAAWLPSMRATRGAATLVDSEGTIWRGRATLVARRRAVAAGVVAGSRGRARARVAFAFTSSTRDAAPGAPSGTIDLGRDDFELATSQSPFPRRCSRRRRVPSSGRRRRDHADRRRH